MPEARKSEADERKKVVMRILIEGSSKREIPCLEKENAGLMKERRGKSLPRRSEMLGPHNQETAAVLKGLSKYNGQGIGLITSLR